MTDVLTKDQRKLNMSRNRGKNTSPEILFRKKLCARGFRGYRIHTSLPGKPDIVFIRQKLAIFIDGCFWHKCPLHFKEPETRKDFWMNKINSNVERDKMVNGELEKIGYTVIRIWEHEIKQDSDKALERVASCLNK
ncbi:very short patch repair endonuclease [Methanocalculus sp.]|uniref:very short patch repair endonuclease n=1 Tax=Methanocalculus sp. TaxID=2004547 RepID=UPI0026045716|nr:very short patch repair endonuclease [Methanocalculus sp.]MDG6250408.1 very short patch repair endonuclease [Methanocalculus sp.]